MKRVIGITGGVGSGKSRILKILREEYGAEVIQADLVAGELEEPGEECYEKIVSALGNGILNEDKTINRLALADLIFRDLNALETVNKIVHPAVWEEVKRRISASPKDLIAVEAALPAKNGDDIYDELWYVYTSRENRLRRLLENRGYSEEKSLGIMENQPKEQEFLSLADRVIDNNGTIEQAENQLKEILGQKEQER